MMDIVLGYPVALVVSAVFKIADSSIRYDVALTRWAVRRALRSQWISEQTPLALHHALQHLRRALQRGTPSDVSTSVAFVVAASKSIPKSYWRLADLQGDISPAVLALISNSSFNVDFSEVSTILDHIIAGNARRLVREDTKE